MNKLKEKGFKVKQKRSLFNKTGYKSYTLEQAIDYALMGSQLRKVHIPKSMYPELVKDLEAYKNNEKGACKRINIKYGFNKEDNVRYQFGQFIDRLYERGFDFMSDKKTQVKIKTLTETISK